MSDIDTDSTGFADFEKSAWVRMAPHYDSLAGQMTRQAVGPILDTLRVKPGEKLIDIATGPGYVAAAAAGRGADAIGLDFSADMIEGARGLFPAIRFEQGDAENLPYGEASFDVAICAFGMLHFPRPGKAMAEAFRVLRPGGRMAFTVWTAPTNTALFGIIREIVTRHADLGAMRLAAGPGAFMLSDPLVCMALMDAARFADPRVQQVPCHYAMKGPEGIMTFMHHCSPRLIPLFEAQTPDVRRRIEQDLMTEGARAVERDGGIVQCPILLASANKPGS